MYLAMGETGRQHLLSAAASRGPTGSRSVVVLDVDAVLLRPGDAALLLRHELWCAPGLEMKVAAAQGL